MSEDSVFFFREQPTIETPRLLIREIRAEDADGMFAMDSDPRVHRYLGDDPVSTIDQIHDVIAHIHRQYESIGIGRWAVEESATGEFIGWTGFKWIDEIIGGRRDYLDLGYRFLTSRWGRGYASESAEACLRFAREAPEMDGVPIHGMVVTGNVASERILQKLGMRHTDSFEWSNESIRFFKF